MTQKQQRNPLDKKLATYALAGAAALAPGAANAGTITYLPNLNLVTNESNSPRTFTANSLQFLTISAVANSATYHQINANPSNGAQVMMNGSLVSDLAFGALIDPNASTGWGAGGKMVEVGGPISPAGDWPTNGSDPGAGYLGVYFQGGDGPHAMWAHILTTASDSGASFTLTDLAFENSPNVAITAGDTGAVPEPSTMALLALGGAGLLAYRRRRSQNA